MNPSGQRLWETVSFFTASQILRHLQQKRLTSFSFLRYIYMRHRFNIVFECRPIFPLLSLEESYSFDILYRKTERLLCRRRSVRGYVNSILCWFPQSSGPLRLVPLFQQTSQGRQKFLLQVVHACPVQLMGIRNLRMDSPSASSSRK